MAGKGKIIIISGPSGSGKTTLYKKLLESEEVTKQIVKVVTVTTRPRRRGEKEGRDYLFVSQNEFLRRKKAGYFLESQKVFDNYYGTPYKRVRDLLAKGNNVLLCIDVKGAKVVCRKFPDAIRIFITVPSFKILKQRLKARGSEDKKTARLRLDTARREVKEAQNYDHMIVNDDLTQAHKHMKSTILSELKS